MDNGGSRLTAATLLLALVPLVLLGGVVWWLIDRGAASLFGTDLPPVEQLHVLRHTLRTDVIHLDVVNSGPDPTTIAQVIVRGAFWFHEVTPQHTQFIH